MSGENGAWCRLLLRHVASRSVEDGPSRPWRAAIPRPKLPAMASHPAPKPSSPTAVTPSRPRFAYPEPLAAEDVAQMDEVLPAEQAAAFLRWLETGEGDPWGERSG